MPEPNRVVVVGPSWIGDMVMAQSLFTGLKARLPETVLDVYAPATTARLCARMPEVDETVESTIHHGELAWRKRRAEAAVLAARGYDQAIVLQRSAKAALVPWLAAIRQRTGVRGEARYGLINDVRTIDERTYPLKAEHYAILGLAREGDSLPAIAPPRLAIDFDNQRRLCERFVLDRDRPAVGFAPGAAYGAAKAWPTTHYAQLASALDAEGWACWIFGSASDREVADAMLAASPRHGVDLIAQTSLADVIDLAAATTRFVGNDTGIMHLASAVAPSVIGLYGSTDPDYAPPLAQESQRLWRAMECAPCRARQCPLGHHACLADMLVADVFAACMEPGAAQIKSLHAYTHFLRG